MKIIISASAAKPIKTTTDFNKEKLTFGIPNAVADALNRVAGSATSGFCKFSVIDASPLKVAVKGYRTLPVKLEKVTSTRKTEAAKTSKVTKVIMTCNGIKKTLDLSVPIKESRPKLKAIINAWYKDEVFGPNKTKFNPIK
jgi:hypothetical protein